MAAAARAALTGLAGSSLSLHPVSKVEARSRFQQKALAAGGVCTSARSVLPRRHDGSRMYTCQMLKVKNSSSFLGDTRSLSTSLVPVEKPQFCAHSVEAVLAPPVSQKIGGFDQIGEPIPDDVSMTDVLKSLPKEVFEVDDLKAWKNVVVTFASVALGYALLGVSPWYLYPLVYAYLGTAMTGLFVIGHDCGHNSFSKNQLVNDIVGTVVFAPLVYPFEPWRIKHNVHHAHTNKLVVDTAWQPFRPFQYDKGSPVDRFLMKVALGPSWWIASVGHWIQYHFNLSLYRPQEKPRVIVSLAAVAAFAAFVLVPLLVTQGIGGFVKWWVLPFLGFHFWMSTFTLVHHTAPHIPFNSARDWNQVKAQLGGTVHCEYPSWVEFLCHNISVHIPHHLSTKIPSYNLRKAHASLEQNWDKYLNKATFGIPLMSSIINNCNLFDTSKRRYVKFDKSQRV